MKILKHIPNTITSLNLLSGAISIIFAFEGHFKFAVLCIILSAVLDFFDGFAARLLKAYSEIGKELDSLADVVSFGLAPSLILFNYLKGIDAGLWQYIPLVIAVFSALRLAKFNIDTRQTDEFLGLPTPACALTIGSLIYFSTENTGVESIINNFYVLPLLSILLSALLVSEVPMLSLKIKSLKWSDNKNRYIYLLSIIPILIFSIILKIHWSGVVFGIFTLYIISSFILSFSATKSKL